jgi:uncharacterized protein YndB with AHSA1/START domain
MQRIEIVQDLALPVERVYGYLSEHENLGPIFGARIERVRDGHDSRNGVGSVRRLKVGPLPWFEETNTQVVPNELIEYRITRGSILRNHRGEMRFASQGDGTRLTYVIEFDAKVPMTGPLLKRTLEGNVRSGLKQVDARA